MIYDYILNRKKNRRFAIWGAGKLSEKGEAFLEQLGIKDYVYIDRSREKQGQLFHGKKVFSPSEVSKDFYLIISTLAFPEIAADLHINGFHDLEDYMNVLDLDYYDALLKWQDEPRVPKTDQKLWDLLASDLRNYVECEYIDWFQESDFADFCADTDFPESYKKGYDLIFEEIPYSRYRRKMMEYYFTYQILGLDTWGEKDVYLDLGAQTSPFVKYLREKKNIKAYALDLEKSKYSDLDCYLQEDVTNTHFEDASIQGMSCHSSFETFLGDADTRLVYEAARILKPGGRLLVLPLYLHEKYLSTTSPTNYHKGYADEGSLECIRSDCRGGLAIGRFYNIEALKRRVLDVAREHGLQGKVYILPNELVECDVFVYLKFILELKK